MLKPLATLALFCALPLAAQTPANQTPADQTPTLHTSATLVQVPTLVQSHAGAVAFNLKDTDFTITDDGIPQRVRLEPESHEPLSLVVLMQTGSYAPRLFEYYRHLAGMLADILAPTPGQTGPNQVAIVNFDLKVTGATPFTSDVSDWTDAINYPEPGADGAAIFDGLAYAFDLLESQPATNRHAILVLSQQQDAGSKTPLQNILRVAGETNTAIYSLSFLASIEDMKEPYRELNNPYSGESWIDLSKPFSLLLTNMRKNVPASIASVTGGESIRFNDQNSLDQALGTLNNHIRNRYLLTFTPTSPKPGLHALSVRLHNHPDLKITARGTYWADKP